MTDLRYKDSNKPKILPGFVDYMLHNFLQKLYMPV